MTVSMAENVEWRAWLDETAEAVLDRVCELSEEPQGVLVGGPPDRG